MEVTQDQIHRLGSVLVVIEKLTRFEDDEKDLESNCVLSFCFDHHDYYRLLQIILVYDFHRITVRWSCKCLSYCIA